MRYHLRLRATASGSMLAVFLLLLFVANAFATVIDFEGVVPANTQNTDSGTRTFNGFDVFVSHGHYQGLGFLQPAPRPSSGSDWLLHDHFSSFLNQPVVITETNDNPFSIQSFQASEWEDIFSRNNVITVTGQFQGGGSITDTFTTDDAFGFETFNFSAAWQNLVSVSFVDLNPDTGFGKLGYDNMFVNEELLQVPGPPTLLLLGFGLIGLVAGLRRRHKA